MRSFAPSKKGAWIGTSLIWHGHWARRGTGLREVWSAGCADAAARVQFLHHLVDFDCRFVVFQRFPFLEGDRSCRAGREAVAEAVAEVFPHELRFAVDHFDGAFMARLSANAAAVAFFFVYVNDLSDDFVCSFLVPLILVSLVLVPLILF